MLHNLNSGILIEEDRLLRLRFVTSIPENVILGMTNNDDAVLEKAADTTAKQLTDGCFT